MATVLIVDDVPMNLSLLEDFLTLHGYEVIIAESGISALRRVQFRQPDIILLDVMMPGISGFETCRQLKANPATREIPVIFLTALDETPNKVKGFELGAVDYITKPIEVEEVLARLRTHLTLRRLRLDLEQEVAAKNLAITDLNAYAHTVAHDLKGPLNNVHGFAQILERDLELLPPDRLRHFCQIIQTSVHRLNNIIDELLLLASVREEEVPAQLVPMKACYEEALRRLEPMIRESGVQLDGPASWPLCVGYGPWLEEVWVNLLSNGIKYGGKPPRLRILASVESDQIRFGVIDNGVGLNEAQCAQVFAPYQRLARERAQGHGLGLSIVKRILEKLGGSVGAAPQPEGGTCFYFTLSEGRL